MSGGPDMRRDRANEQDFKPRMHVTDSDFVIFTQVSNPFASESESVSEKAREGEGVRGRESDRERGR